MNHQHSHEDRTHRLVPTCSPYFLIVWVLASLLSTPLHASIVSLFAETTLPQVDFAVTELRADLTIIDCNNLTRAFTAWGDRSASGQVDANGLEIPNLTGPTGWVIEGLTIQNGVTDAEDNGLDLSDDGGALCMLNGAKGTIRNCTISNCASVDMALPEWRSLLDLTGLAYGKGNRTRREPMEIQLDIDHPICRGLPKAIHLVDEPF